MNQAQLKVSNIALDWDQIECVLLDMDGTVLDLRYDNHVWHDLVPAAFAEKSGRSIDDCRQTLLDHMAEIHGSIQYYSYDYWNEFADIDLVEIHRQATDLIAWRPGALAFLRWLRTTGRRAIIATNAHRDSVVEKDLKINLSGEVDAIVSSHDFAEPKEAEAFWDALHTDHPFENHRCLFIDDNEPVLDSAQRRGIEHLLGIATPDSRRPTRYAMRYPSFDDFAEICPAIRDF